MKNIVAKILTSGGCLLIALGMMSGHVQQVVPFADPLNEMVFCAGALMMSVLCVGMNYETK